MPSPHTPALSMYKIILLGLFLLFGLVPQTAESQIGIPIDDQVRDRLRLRIESAMIEGHIETANDIVFASTALPQFYERRGYAPVWSENAVPRTILDSLLIALKSVAQDGLHPEDYHTSRIDAMLKSIRTGPADWQDADAAMLTDLDLLATDAFLICGSHLLAGRVNPVTIDAEWFTKSRERDIAALLDTVVVRGNPGATLLDLLPNQRGYFRLRECLREYRKLAAGGGWPEIPEGKTLHPGDRDPRVRVLRKRLAFTRDASSSASDDPDLFDDSLAAAVSKFQLRNGLDADSAVGPKTLATLNVPARDRAHQIALNLERWRWLPEGLGERYIIVNIANFELDVVERDSTVLGMKVIVGRPYRRTPVFSDRMSYLVLNPYWNVPPNLAIQDIVPEIRKSNEYLNAQQIKVFQGYGDGMRTIDPTKVDWSKITKNNLPYWFRQDPGPHNSLGRIKFMFPNPYNVYLHDTPKRELFAKTERGFSSGCIRVQDPLGLATYLLAPDPKWSRTSLENALETAVDQTVTLPQPVPVHILYWTAWVTPSGILNFREDIYKRDKPLADAMAEPPPSAD